MSFCRFLEWLVLAILVLALIPVLGQVFSALGKAFSRLCAHLCRIWILIALLIGALLGALLCCCREHFSGWWENDCSRLILVLLGLTLLAFWWLLCWIGRCGVDRMPTFARLSLHWWILLFAILLYVLIRHCCSEVDEVHRDLEQCERLLLAALWLFVLAAFLRYLACRFCPADDSSEKDCSSRLRAYAWLVLLLLLASAIAVYRCCGSFGDEGDKDDPELAMVGIWWDGERDVEPAGRFAGEDGAHLRWSFEPALGFPAGGFDLQRRPSGGSWATLNPSPITPVTEWGDEGAVSGSMWLPAAVERIPPAVWDQFRDAGPGATPFTDLLTALGQAAANPAQVYYFVESPEASIAQPLTFYTDPADVESYLASYFASGPSEERPPLATWEHVPIETIMTMSVFPDVARMVGMYYIDRDREPDVEYDYRVIGYWADGERDYTVYGVSRPSTVSLTAPLLDAPESPLPLGELDGHPLSDDRSVGLRWVPPQGTPATLTGPIDTIDSVVFSVEHKVLVDASTLDFAPGDPPPTCPGSATSDGFALATRIDVETGEPTESSPVVVLAIEDEAAPGTYAWPERYFTHGALVYGCHAYRILGRDLFGRPSPFSTPGVATVADQTPPPPPAIAAATVYQVNDASLPQDVRDTFFPSGSDHTFVLLVSWVWPEAVSARAPDLRLFNVHVNSSDYDTFVQPSSSAWREKGAWDVQDIASAGVAETAPMPIAYADQGLTEPGNRYYAVAMVDSDTTELRTALLAQRGIGVVTEIASLAALGLEAGDTDPVLYAHVGISAADELPYANEGAVCAPVVVFARDLTPPSAPSPPPALSFGPSPADAQGNASMRTAWSANSLYTYSLYRVDVADLGTIRNDFADDEIPACLPRPVRADGDSDEEWAEIEEEFNIRVTAALQPGSFSPVSPFPILPAGASAEFETKVDATMSSRHVFAARAIDAAGNRSDLSCPSAVILVEDAFPPRAPVIQEVKGADNATLVTWARNPEADVDRYTVYRASLEIDAESRRRMEIVSILHSDGTVAPDGPASDAAASGGSAPYETFTWTDAHVVPGNLYYYRIDAVDLSGNRSELSGTATAKAFDQQPPDSPAWGSPALAAVSGHVTLTLAAPAENGLKLSIQRRLDSQALWQDVGGWRSYDGTAFEDASIAGGGTYHYRLRVMDSAGNRSAWSGTESIAVPE